jgi:hypothetical protein
MAEDELPSPSPSPSPSRMFQPGDRVVLQGLKNAAHFNGCHGHIGSSPDDDDNDGRFPVNLDLPYWEDGTVVSPRLGVKPDNIRSEKSGSSGGGGKNLPLADDIVVAAGIENGCLDWKYGPVFVKTLEVVLYLSAMRGTTDSRDPTMRWYEDFVRLKESRDTSSLKRMNRLLAAACEQWNEDVCFVHGRAFTFHTLSIRQYKAVHTAEQRDNDVLRALHCPLAAKSWGMRIHGTFYAVGFAPEHGMYFIPTTNHDMVYLVVGQDKSIHSMTPNPNPTSVSNAITATFLPYYSRLVLAGNVMPAHHIATPSQSCQEKLLATLEQAKEQGRVVSRFRQLEVHDGALEGRDPSDDPPSSSPRPVEQGSMVEPLFRPGDCVVLLGLKNAVHMNGRYGHIGSTPTSSDGLFPVNLDLLLEDGTSQVAAKPANLQRSDSSDEGRIRRSLSRIGVAEVRDGILDERLSAAVTKLLDMVETGSFWRLQRYHSSKDLVGFQADQSQGAVTNDLNRLNGFLNVAYARWNEPLLTTMVDGADTITFYTEMVLDLERHLEIVTNDQRDYDMIKALKSPLACKNWGMRLHGTFHVVGYDKDEGTYLIPTSNHDMVYVVVGYRNGKHGRTESVYDMVPDPESCPAITATFLPFYSRLVLSGGVVLAFTNTTNILLAQRSNHKAKLLASLEQAKEQGRVVSCLHQLELEVDDTLQLQTEE